MFFSYTDLKLMYFGLRNTDQYLFKKLVSVIDRKFLLLIFFLFYRLKKKLVH